MRAWRDADQLARCDVYRNFLLTVVVLAFVVIGAAGMWLHRYEYLFDARGDFVLRADRLRGEMCWLPVNRDEYDAMKDALAIPVCQSYLDAQVAELMRRARARQ